MREKGVCMRGLNPLKLGYGGDRQMAEILGLDVRHCGSGPSRSCLNR